MCANMRRGKNPRRMENTKEKRALFPHFANKDSFIQSFAVCDISAFFKKRTRLIFVPPLSSLLLLFPARVPFLSANLVRRRMGFFSVRQESFFSGALSYFFGRGRIGGGDSGKKKMLGGRTYSIYHRMDTTLVVAVSCFPST